MYVSTICAASSFGRLPPMLRSIHKYPFKDREQQLLNGAGGEERKKREGDVEGEGRGGGV